MRKHQALAAGRESFRLRSWADAFRLLEAADRESPLDPEDLERLATAAYLIGKDVESEAVRARAHSRAPQPRRPGGRRPVRVLAGIRSPPTRRLRSRLGLARQSGTSARRGRARMRGARLSPDSTRDPTHRRAMRLRRTTCSARPPGSRLILPIATSPRSPVTDRGGRWYAWPAFPKESHCSMRRWRQSSPAMCRPFSPGTSIAASSRRVTKSSTCAARTSGPRASVNGVRLNPISYAIAASA